jgi:hypothetical protein
MWDNILFLLILAAVVYLYVGVILPKFGMRG